MNQVQETPGRALAPPGEDVIFFALTGLGELEKLPAQSGGTDAFADSNRALGW